MEIPEIIICQVTTQIQKEAIMQVRNLVFVVEQNVSADEEYDEYDLTATHLCAAVDGKIVGTMRFRNTEKGVKFERFAVLKEYRTLGVGKALLLEALSMVNSGVYLHAQVQVENFYAKYGFVRQGEMFEEANISHYKMILVR